MAIQTGDQAYTNFNIIQHPLITTNGWDVQVKWRDQRTDWFPLHLIKESNPIEVSEHAIANVYSNEPDFIPWVRIFLKNHDRLVNKGKSRRQRNIFKFGL